MSLSDLASLGSFVSGIAVLASLIFLFFQMRQMTEQVRQAERNQRALMQQGRAERVCANMLGIAAEHDLSRLFARGRLGDETLTEEELFRFLLLCRVGFISGEDSFLQHLSGALEDEAFGSYAAGVRSFLASPGMRAAWRMAAPEYGAEYRDYMNRALAETKIAPPTFGLERWKTALAADR